MTSIGQLVEQLMNSVAVAGGAGGFFRWASMRPREPKELLISIPVGVIAAVYLGPAIEPMLTWMAAGPQLAGFIAGVIGISAAGFILDVAASWARLKSGKGKGNDNNG